MELPTRQLNMSYYGQKQMLGEVLGICDSCKARRNVGLFYYVD
jgi:hypothetical protein